MAFCYNNICNFDLLISFKLLTVGSGEETLERKPSTCIWKNRITIIKKTLGESFENTQEIVNVKVNDKLLKQLSELVLT